MITGHKETPSDQHRRVAIYVRVSTRDQRLLQQFREVRRMVERRGWTD